MLLLPYFIKSNMSVIGSCTIIEYTTTKEEEEKKTTLLVQLHNYDVMLLLFHYLEFLFYIYRDSLFRWRQSFYYIALLCMHKKDMWVKKNWLRYFQPSSHSESDSLNHFLTHNCWCLYFSTRYPLGIKSARMLDHLLNYWYSFCKFSCWCFPGLAK